jgi:4-hydroxybenzoate polyprenyltransferase
MISGQGGIGLRAPDWVCKSRHTGGDPAACYNRRSFMLPDVLTRSLRIVLRMIRIEHTVFALPFAFLGAFLAASGLPRWETSLWILLAMVGARSAAMAFNRLVDRDYDSSNPRTAGRELPRGRVGPGAVRAFIVGASLLFFLAAWMLNPLAFALSPLALSIVLGYSYTKRFTSYSHLFLGLSLGIAPMGGWIAVTGSLAPEPFILAAAVLFWVAGFDVIYACQDVDFDRGTGLYSIPATLGIARALHISALFHAIMILLLAWAFILFELSVASWLGLALVALALVWEHRLVKPNDLSRVNTAFFSINGVVSILLFLFVGLDLCLFV